ncbi:MAG: LysM domain-containing protein [Clostridia bacterium]|nr:LysM domain-containing protein [Clostridia bacterium]
MTVKAGDTPIGLAKKYGVSVEDIMRGAGITDPRKLIAGRTITVTNGGGSVSKTKQCLKSEPAHNSSSGNANSPPAPASPNPQKPDK